MHATAPAGKLLLKQRRLVCWVAAALAFASTVHGDEIHLKNGNTINGLIVQETAATYVIDLGFGTTEIEKTRVRAVDRSDGAGGQSMREAWQRKYFLQKRFIPDSQVKIAGEYRRLRNRRSQARAANREVPRLRAAIERARKDIADMERRRRELGETLQSATVDTRDHEQIVAYNKLVTENNVLSGKLNTTYQGIRTREKQIEGAGKSISTYTAALKQFNQRFEDHREAQGRDRSDEEDVFLNEMARRLEGFNTEFQSYKITTRRQGSGILVTARLNDAVDATFMLDTGASLVTLTPALAQRMQLDTSRVKPARMTVADGRQVRALPVVLRSMAVGDARVEHVRAVVMQGAPGPGIDGLLGMSFLRGFLIEVDPGTSSLVLERLAR